MSLESRIKRLGALTKIELSYADYVSEAFALGLWHNSFPAYFGDGLNHAHSWDLRELAPDANSVYHTHIFRFQFISDTGDSWHQCYRDLRSKGWQRRAVHRNGGLLKYLFEAIDASKPEGYQRIHLLLEISISTCKQIQIGTELKEVPIMKTVCEDLIEVEDDSTAKYAMPTELPPTEHLEKVSEFGQLLGVSGLGHDDLEPSTIEPDNNKDSIPF